MASHIDMSGRVTIVTGGTRSIGRRIAERYLDAGSEVVICGRNAPESPVAAGGRTALFVAADVREPDQFQSVVDSAMQTHGRLDVLVNNAGGTVSTDTATVSPRFQAGVINLNFTAALNCSVIAYRAMRDCGAAGNILLISSVAALSNSPGAPAYAAAKAALINLASTFAIEFGPQVRVNCVTAGLILTEQAELHYGNDGGAAVADTLAMRRMGTPDDVADACLLLCSEYASWVTGSNFVVHGGGYRPVYQDARDA